MTTMPRWHHALLPGELRDDPDGRRSARDWVVDALMYLIALGIGIGILADTWDDHGEVMLLVDIVFGVASLIALWWRRSHPGTVGVLTAAASIVSAAAAGPWVVATFNVALRGTRREIVTVLAVTAVSIQLFPRI
jgi:uncharacterized membrane protein